MICTRDSDNITPVAYILKMHAHVLVEVNPVHAVDTHPMHDAAKTTGTAMEYNCILQLVV
jgi:hypothetical protein